MSALRDRTLSSSGALASGHKLGRYEILTKLASGGMAVVYVASAGGVGGFARLVALKVLHANLAHEEEFISMFLDEARLAARIRHPNVVPTIDISDTIETGYFLVMEYIEGDHLGALLSSSHKQGERIPVAVVLRIVIDALGGLGAAHDLRDDASKPLNIVHRDVSPHNILVGKDGISRLTDFGVAKAEDRLTHTRDGQVKGKLAYMAPEQASSGSTDSRSDLFSMGIILWECVTGRRLFRADNTAATLTKLLHEPIAAPSAVDPSLAPLDAVLEKALQRDPSARFQTADEFIEALEQIAPRVGGVATRRAVTKAVKQYAADKLARERKQIESAQRAVRGVAPESPAEGTEPSMPSSASTGGSSASEVSLWSGSMSRAKLGGVLSSATAPRLFTRARASRGAADELPPVAEEITVPPPLGEVGDLGVPDLPDLPTGAPSERGRQLLLGALIVALAAAVWFALRPAGQPAAHVPPSRAAQHESSHLAAPVLPANVTAVAAPVAPADARRATEQAVGSQGSSANLAASSSSDRAAGAASSAEPPSRSATSRRAAQARSAARSKRASTPVGRDEPAAPKSEEPSAAPSPLPNPYTF
jgi:serine/threonine-protein kinase